MTGVTSALHHCPDAPVFPWCAAALQRACVARGPPSPAARLHQQQTADPVRHLWLRALLQQVRRGHRGAQAASKLFDVSVSPEVFKQLVNLVDWKYRGQSGMVLGRTRCSGALSCLCLFSCTSCRSSCALCTTFRTIAVLCLAPRLQPHASCPCPGMSSARIHRRTPHRSSSARCEISMQGSR